jgi:HSP20 family protein
METLTDELPAVMERFLNPAEAWNEVEKFAPAANLIETETGYELTLELPGMKPEEFNVEFTGGALWISGVKKEEKEEKGKTFHRVERRYGEFRRGFRLPVPVAEDKVTAEYKEGILRVAVPKIAEAKPKRVEVKA